MIFMRSTRCYGCDDPIFSDIITIVIIIERRATDQDTTAIMANYYIFLLSLLLCAHPFSPLDSVLRFRSILLT